MVEEININNGIALFEELAGQITNMMTGSLPHCRDSNTMAFVVKQPYGVQLGIAPWNASLFLALRSVITPIACGNTAILKASELSPGVHHFLGRLLKKAGFPPGVLNIIQHRREDAAQIFETLISHPAVRKVNFTGSTAVGKVIAAKAAQYAKPCILELGGKAPLIVFEDADLEEAAKAAVMGAFVHVSRHSLLVLPTAEGHMN
jgi:acyl-CoA reductase-like NAD-dependent aldehyde dehydrogenase